MTAPGTELIRLEGVKKLYGRRSVLEVDTLTIHRGDRILVHGPNGSGKSTLLKVLGGIVPVDRGKVWWAPELAGALGYVPQQGGMYGDLSVLDNLNLRASLHGATSTDPRRARHVKSLGLLPLLTRRFDELSGGFQRLATIAAALHVSPAWLLLDEPLSGVDAHHVRMLHEELSEPARPFRLVAVSAPTAEGFPSANRRIEIEGGRIR